QAAQVRGNYRELLSECRNDLSPLIPTLGPAMQKYEWVAGTGNDIVHTKAVDNFGVMLPGFGHDDLLCFPLAGADSNSEPLQAAIVCRAMNESVFLAACQPGDQRSAAAATLKKTRYPTSE